MVEIEDKIISDELFEKSLSVICKSAKAGVVWREIRVHL